MAPAGPFKVGGGCEYSRIIKVKRLSTFIKSFFLTSPYYILYTYAMSSIPSRKVNKIATLESLIEGLDERGLLVLQVLLGQQAMSLLAKEPINKVIPKVILPKEV